MLHNSSQTGNQSHVFRGNNIAVLEDKDDPLELIATRSTCVLFTAAREIEDRATCTACRKRRRPTRSSHLRSNGVNDVASLLVTDSAMCSGVIGDQRKPKDGPETAHTPCEAKKNLFSGQEWLIKHGLETVAILTAAHYFVFSILNSVQTFVMLPFECLPAHHICRRQPASPKSGRCNRWAAVQRRPQSWTPAPIWPWDESAPGAEPSGPTLPSWRGTSHP